ncbi:UDP-glucose 4-epimerase GalE [uncultured Helicobacter sp.]|uniref:UDP-glucose 4-epimerase GalE n=1 Tax=uncultured Helicobacter sp. TaxID=175537 RepID=UPI00374E620B
MGGGVARSIESSTQSATIIAQSQHQNLTSHAITTPIKPIFIQGDLNDTILLRQIFDTYHIECVLHFAAFAYVGESVLEPQKYYLNNVAHTLNLLSVMREFDCKNIIFSSTCATYGNPHQIPITESHPQSPINPYGRSKLMVEQILQDFSKAYNLSYVILRYFNAAGASNFFNIGESHNPETHLIPLILQTALKQRNTPLEIFGLDYPTKDGSCVRDYIHIDDLALAHILSWRYLRNGGKSDVFNLGNNEGFSVLEVLHKAQEITNTEIPYIHSKRREGDPAILVGDCRKAKAILGWNPHFCDLETILQTAYRWHKNPRY